MKKTVYALFGMFFSCFKPQPATQHTPSNPAADPEQFERYTGSFYKENYVWTGAMNLCWTELCQSVLKGPLRLKTEAAEALRLVDCFNHPVCTQADLDAPSYYVKAGFGPKTVALINRESRARFPDKSFADIKVDLAEEDIISYAYFLKKVAYETPFSRCKMLFEGLQVQGFEAGTDQKQALEVLHYASDERFILRIRLKDKGDELLLAKGFDPRHPAETLRALATFHAQKTEPLGKNDFFKMPFLGLNCRRDYEALIGKRLDNEGFKQYFIGQMFENIAFEMDETGARVESQAVISVERSMAAPPENRRYFYLNKPFWVILKRSNTPNPYFLLGVNNKEIMQTI